MKINSQLIKGVLGALVLLLSFLVISPEIILAANYGAGTYGAGNYNVGDATAPSGGSITYSDGDYTSTSVALTVSDGTDSVSGVNTSSRTVQRKSATLSGETCGSFGSFAAISVSGSYPNFTDSGVSSGNCYQYEYQVSDNAGSQTTYTSTSVVKVLYTAPATQGCSDTTPTGTTPWLYEANPNNGNSITLRFTNWQSPADHFVLEYGTEAGKYTFGVTSFGNKDTNSYTVSSLSPNTTYYFRVRPGNGCATGTWSNEISAKTKGLISTNQLEIIQSELATQPTTPSSCQTYTVKAGDTLWSVARNLLGDGSKYRDIANQNKDQYSSLESSNVVRLGWELKVDCRNQSSPTSTTSTTVGGGETQKTNESKSQTGYDVNVKVVDTDKKPVTGANVTIHSTPQTAKTNTDGVATFANVEPGNHTVQIAYNNYTGEQSINLTGDVKEFDLTIQVKPQSVFLDPRVIVAFAIMGLVIVFLTFKLLRKK